MKHSKAFLSAVLPLVITITARAENLSNLALYNRCYGQLTGLRPNLTDSVTIQIKQNKMSAITACMNILNRAVLTADGGTTIGDKSDTIAKAVLGRMHNLHYSWLQNQGFALLNGNYIGMVDHWDSSTSAMYFTRAMFQEVSSIRGAITGNDILGAVRPNMDPPLGIAGHMDPYPPTSKSDYSVSEMPFAPQGELLGIRKLAPNFLYGHNYGWRNGSGYDHVPEMPWYQSSGGGMIGNYVYMLQNVRESHDFWPADGAVRTYRKWARAVYHDLLCRNMPVNRLSDAQPYVRPNSKTIFRKSTQCTICHMSQDQLAGVIRNYSFLRELGPSNPIDPKKNLMGSVDSHSWFEVAPNLKGKIDSEWTEGYSDYWQSEPSGHLVMRNYLGNMIDVPVTSIESVGQAIANQDDFYICMAKRYYEYFTGISANTGDLGDPTAPALSTADMFHRDAVIGLGKKLRQTDNVRGLIGDILNLPQYRNVPVQ